MLGSSYSKRICTDRLQGTCLIHGKNSALRQCASRVERVRESLDEGGQVWVALGRTYLGHTPETGRSSRTGALRRAEVADDSSQLRP